MAASAAAPTATDTDVGPSRAAPSRIAVTVTSVAPASSATTGGQAASATNVESDSSSAIASKAYPTPRPDAAVEPTTDSVSGPSTVVSSFGVNVKVPLALVAFAAIVSTTSATVA